jgi:hypothetical protein
MLTVIRTRMLVLLGLGFLSATTAAQEVYRWVDENGVVHFSQTAPAADTQGVDRLQLEASRPADYDPEEDRYNVAEQAERMQAYREQLAAEREAHRERAAREAVRQPAAVYPEQSIGTAVPPWWWDRPPNRPRPPRPEPPIERPPATLLPPDRWPQ